MATLFFPNVYFVPLGYQEEFVLTVLSSWLSCCQEVKSLSLASSLGKQHRGK